MKLWRTPDERKRNQQVTNGYMKPKFSLWRWLGFGQCAWPQMDDENFPDMPPGRLIIVTNVKLGFSDRIRILISGEAHIVSSVKTNVPVDRSVCHTAFSVDRPGGAR